MKKKPASKKFTWRMPTPCADCPLSDSKAGKHLAKSLNPGRIQGIKAGLLQGGHFMCHETTRQIGNGSNLVCAGALDFQHARGITSRYEEMCRTFEGCKESRKEIARRLKGLVRPETSKAPIPRRKVTPC